MQVVACNVAAGACGSPADIAAAAGAVKVSCVAAGCVVLIRGSSTFIYLSLNGIEVVEKQQTALDGVSPGYYYYARVDLAALDEDHIYISAPVKLANFTAKGFTVSEHWVHGAASPPPLGVHGVLVGGVSTAFADPARKAMCDGAVASDACGPPVALSALF